MRARQIPQALSLIIGFALLGGCGWGPPFPSVVRPDDAAFALAYFDSVRTGRIDYALAALDSESASIPGERDSLMKFAAYVPAGPLDSLHIIGADRFTSLAVDLTEQYQSNLTYEYHSARSWGAVAIAITGRPTSRFIHGIHAYRFEQSLEQTNAFAFRSKGAGHYLMLVLVLVCLGSSVWVAVLALRSRMERRWVWALFSLVGTGTVVFNWTTGRVGFALLRVLFLDAAIGRGGEAAPWILQAAFPVGALMTWRRIQQARNPTPSPDASVPTVTDAATEEAISSDNPEATI